MKIKVVSPTKALIVDYSEAELAQLETVLTYTNTANAHQLKRHYNNNWYKNKNRVLWEKQLEEIKKTVKNTLVFKNGAEVFIRPGSIPYLKTDFPDLVIENEVVYPTAKKIPWAKSLPFELHGYQAISAERLVEEKHANVELCTGAGKSAILLKVCRETGFRAAIVAPSKSIFDELLEKFKFHLGAGNVGAFGDGKKNIGKKLTICIGDSIANIKRDSKEWEFFSKLDMMCVDESHTWGAETLEDICHGVFADIPYRLFFSGTQTRGDGAEKLLQSIIGTTVHQLTTSEAVTGGYICPHSFRIVELESSNPSFNSKDALEMKRIHFLRNKNIAAFVAKLANASAVAHGKQTLVLVEEMDQVAMLSRLLTVPFAYAHSEKKPDRLDALGLTKVDPQESVERFNKNEVKVLIGTSCIATGTNIFPTHQTVNWVGGASEIKTKQGAVGRSVRKLSASPFANKCVPKDEAIIFDFKVRDVYVMEAHLEKRIEYYKDSGSLIKFLKLGKA